MSKFLVAVIACLISISAISQHTILIKIANAETKELLSSATVSIPLLKKTIITDTSGSAQFRDLPQGSYAITITYVGLETLNTTITVPHPGVIEFYLVHSEDEEEEVIIQSTRTSRNIKNVPTRVETIELEEIDEKSNMRPSNVSMLLHESTGILVQQTSATSGNASIRIQGLDGRYTQLLKDGFAAFGNFASGLSVMEIPPLDLKQVEIIKGPASPLFGGGAIAGVVNFISKTPKEKPENNLLLNASNIGQFNLGYFSSKRSTKTGYTLLALFNKQRIYDVDKDDFTEIPRSLDFTIHPKLFLYGKNSVLIMGNSFTLGKREGGDVQVLQGKGDAYHRYYEENNTIRNITTVEWQKKFSDNKNLTVKQSFSIFDRQILVPDYIFKGISYNSFTDIAYLANMPSHSLVTGITAVYDNFNEKSPATARDNKIFTPGLYVQDTWDVTSRFKVESGLRFDFAHYSNSTYSNNEFFVLPRISALFHFTGKLSSRIGGGFGYKLPGIFTEETEADQFKSISQVNGAVAERSIGFTGDLNLKTRAGDDLEISINQLFFYTRINDPLIVINSGVSQHLQNAAKPVESKGIETNVKFIYRHNFKLFLGYTYTDANARHRSPGTQFLSLVPRHKFNSALIYEKHESIKLGLEAYYTGTQYLSDRFRTPGYWEFGFMAEKIWKDFSVYINLENFTDARQSRYKRVVNDPHSAPRFDDIWNHTEGFVLSGGVKIKL